MNNASSQQYETQNETSFLEISSSECIAWLTVLMSESVAIVTLNILTIIVFFKKLQSSYAQHVPGDQPGSCRFVSWRMFRNRTICGIRTIMLLLAEYPKTTFCCQLIHNELLSFSFSDNPRCDLVRKNARDTSSF